MLFIIELLCQKLRSIFLSVHFYNAAVGLIRKEQLGDSGDSQCIKQPAYNGKISKISAALGRSSFNILLITENILSLNQAQRDEYHIDGLDTDKRCDDPSESINQKVS